MVWFWQQQISYLRLDGMSMAEPFEKCVRGADCGIPDACERIVPIWLIILDNAPTVVMFLLGSALIWEVSPIYSMLFLVYCGLSIIMFWRLICPWCHHFGTTGCPCGYARIASRLFERKTGKDFKKIFTQNIGVVFPCWFVPLGTGIYLLWTRFNWSLFFLFLAFCLVSFILIPSISRFIGCKSCKNKNECPWMSCSSSQALQ